MLWRRPRYRHIVRANLRILRLILGAAVLGAACSNQTATYELPADGSPQDERLLGVVLKVIDGDTIDVAISGADTRIRIIGIDTPEVQSPYRDAECFGTESSAYTTAMLPPGTRVRLTGDIEKRDQYDRLLAYVYREQDELFINLELIRAGYATDFPFEPNTTHAERFAKARVDAKALNLGLWGTCGGPDRLLE